MTAQRVDRLVGDGNDLLVVHRFETADVAEAFFNSGELREGMEAADSFADVEYLFGA